MLVMLFSVFWLTVIGANYPSSLLQALFDLVGKGVGRLLSFTPVWLHSLLIDGIYMTTARVVSVMLPPMLIFFPLFTGRFGIFAEGCIFDGSQL